MKMNKALTLMGKVVEYTPRQERVLIVGFTSYSKPEIAQIIPGADGGLVPKEVVVSYVDESGKPKHATRCYKYEPEYLRELQPQQYNLKNGTLVELIFESGECLDLRVVNYVADTDNLNSQFCGLINEDTFKTFSKTKLPRSLSYECLKQYVKHWGYNDQYGRLGLMRVSK